MMPTQRRQAILAEVRKASAVSADGLAEMFGVSVETIRRDLRGLRDKGLLERVYGGALPVQSTEGTFAARSALHGTRKLAEAYLNYLYSEEGQEIAARNFYRPRSTAVPAALTKQFPKIKLYTIDDSFGGWTKAQKTHFADGGVFDSIYQPQ